MCVFSRHHKIALDPEDFETDESRAMNFEIAKDSRKKTRAKILESEAIKKEALRRQNAPPEPRLVATTIQFPPARFDMLHGFHFINNPAKA